MRLTSTASFAILFALMSFRHSACIALVALAAAPVAASRPPSPLYWSFAKVMVKIDGLYTKLDGKRIRIDAKLTLCSGRGRSVVVDGQRRWRSFDCIRTTIGPSNRDIEFRVQTLGRHRLRLTDARVAN